ncbi:cupin domain-containing protein [Nonomuraea rubra]
MSLHVPAGFTPSTEPGLYVPPGEGLVKWMSGDVYTMKATKKETNGTLSVVEGIILPGAGPLAHAHTMQDEAFYVLDGELEFLDGDRTFVAGTGSLVFIGRRRRHRFKNISDTPAKMLFVYTPAGPEDFFIDGGEDPRPGEQPTVWDMERLAQIADIVERTGAVFLPE